MTLGFVRGDSGRMVDVGDRRTAWGFFRWLDKGGKPEYVGVTLLDGAVDRLRRSRFEFRWVKSIEVGVEVDFERLAAAPRTADRCLGRSYERDFFDGGMSVPLYVSLVALGESLQNAEFRAWFFREAAGG